MKNITGFLKILLFNLLVFTGLLAQDTTYVRLDDAGGTIFSNYELEQLELYADSLRLDLPEQYRADFKVYDFGFYRHLEVYGEYGFEEAFEELKPTITKPYYLLIARQSDKSGMNTKVFVEFKLPEDNNYPCASSAFQESSCNIFKYSFNNTSGSAGIRILSGLKEIHGLTNNIYSCCDFSEGETTCGLSANEVRKILLGAGYMNYNGLQIDVTGVDGISEIIIHMDERCPITQAKAYNGPHSLFSSEYQYTIGDEFHLLAELNDFKSAMEDMNIVVDIPVPLVIKSPPSFFVDFYSETGGKVNFDYKEKIVVLQIPGQPVQVYTKIEIRPEAFNTGEFNPEWSLFNPKKIFSWFVKRSATNPTTVLFGVAADYFIDGTFSYFFDQSKYDTYWMALYTRFLEKGITGLGISLLTNIIDSPASVFIGQIAEYMISTDYDDWNLPVALGTAMTGTILQGTISISAKAGKFIKPFLTDVVSSVQGAKMLAHCFLDRRLVNGWVALRSTGLATDVNVWLPRVSKWLDEGVEFVENGAKVIIRKGGDDVGEIVDDLLRVKYAGLGGDVVCEASKTTTVIGRWSGGTEDLWNTGLARQVDDVTGNPAGMNILGNVDNTTPAQIWSNQNKPWLDAAIERDDVIRAVSEPMDIDNVFYVISDDIPANAFSSPQSLSNYLTSLSDAEASQLGFYGREIRHLFQNGYTWDATTKVFIK